MDLLDKKITMDLFTNCRQSYQELALKYNISLNATKKRIQKLLGLGFLEFQLLPHLAMLDANQALSFITTTGQEDQQTFIKELGNNRMITVVATLPGNSYIIYSVYSGLEGLSEFNKYLRSLEPVKEIEVHQILAYRGSNVEISKKQLRIIHCLIDNPRMQLSKIAKCSGYSAKTVRKALNEVMDNEGFWFGVKLNHSLADDIGFMIRIEWDEQESELQDILEWLNVEFPVENWVPKISATRPIIFAYFLVGSKREINPIIEKIKKTGFAKSATFIVGSEGYYFDDLRRYWLEERFIEAGLKPTLE